MKKNLLSQREQLILLFCIFAVLMVAMPEFAAAKNSLGLGGSEQSIKPTGIFATPLHWIYVQQQWFYTGLRKILLSMKQNGTGIWLLVVMSFAYGVFHAAGPGHGKVVISSYMLANETAAKRGIFLSFASALIQGCSAIVIAFLAVFILRGSGISYGDIQFGTEILSYLLVTLIGVWLIWRKAGTAMKARLLSTKIMAHKHHHDHAHTHEHNHEHEHSHEHGHTHEDGHTHDAHCGCGHDHSIDPKTLEGTFSLKRGASAILAVGLRPCSGALIVLIFTFLNELYIAGVISVLAMSIGTGITVSSLAVLATWGKGLALKYSKGSNNFGWLFSSIELFGAILVFIMGLSLLLAALI